MKNSNRNPSLRLAKKLLLSVYLFFGMVCYAPAQNQINYVKRLIAFFPWEPEAGKRIEKGKGLVKGAELTTVDGKGNIYITDPGTGIKVFSDNGRLVRIVTPPLDISKNSADISIDGDGSVYYGLKEKIYRVHPDGKVSIYENKSGETTFVHNGTVYLLKGVRWEKAFEIRKMEELKEGEIIHPNFEPDDFTRSNRDGKEYLAIKPEKLKEFIKYFKNNIPVEDEIKLQLPSSGDLNSDFKVVGFDQKGRIVVWASFEKRPGDASLEEFFTVYSPAGNLISKIPLDPGYLENKAWNGDVDVLGNIYRLCTTKKGAYLYRWIPQD